MLRIMEIPNDEDVIVERNEKEKEEKGGKGGSRIILKHKWRFWWN